MLLFYQILGIWQCLRSIFPYNYKITAFGLGTYQLGEILIWVNGSLDFLEHACKYIGNLPIPHTIQFMEEMVSFNFIKKDFPIKHYFNYNYTV